MPNPLGSRLVSLLAVPVVSVALLTSQLASANVLNDKKLADAYDRNLDRAVKATALLSAPVAAEKAGIFTLGKIFGRIAARTVLLCGEAASGGFAIGSAIGGVFADPPVSTNEFYETCGMTPEEITYIPDIQDAPYLGTIPALIESAIPYTQLISSIPGIEVSRRDALAQGHFSEAAQIQELLNHQLDQLAEVTPLVALALNQMQAGVSAFLADFPNAMSIAAITALQNDIAADGIPDVEQDAIKLFGFTDDHIHDLETSLFALDPASIDVNTAFSELALSSTELTQELLRYRASEPVTGLLLAGGLLLIRVRSRNNAVTV